MQNPLSIVGAFLHALFLTTLLVACGQEATTLKVAPTTSDEPSPVGDLADEWSEEDATGLALGGSTSRTAYINFNEYNSATQSYGLSQQAEIVARLKVVFNNSVGNGGAAAALRITTVKPARTESYTTINVGQSYLPVVSNGEPRFLDTLGVANQMSRYGDYGDQYFALVAHAFTSAADNPDVEIVARVIAHQLGHTFGLVHVTNAGNVMNPQVAAGAFGFQRDATLTTPIPKTDGSQYTVEDQPTRLQALFGTVTLATAPTGLAVTVSSPTSVRLNWSDSPDEASYDLQRRVQGSNWVSIATPAVNATTYVDAGLTEGTAYDYRVLALNAIGVGNASNIASVATPLATPLAPSGLVATATGPTVVRLTWTDNASNETAFAIERALGAGAFAEITRIGPNIAVFDDVTVAEGTTYRYQVRAVRLTIFSAYSNVASVPTPIAAPATPTDLTATPTSPTSVQLRWTDKALNETGFIVERRVAATGVFALIDTIGANETSYTDGSATERTVYEYRVAARNSAGLSAYSSIAMATTPPTPPTAPSSLVATVASAQRINLTWTDNAANETGFRLERRMNGGAWSVVATPSANVISHPDLSVTENATWEYQVSAVNLGLASAPSNKVTATTPFAPPLAPTALVVTAIGGGTLRLQWDDAANNETGFIVERATAAVGPFTQLPTLVANTVTFDDSGLTAGTTYYYQVFAIRASARSAPTTVVGAIAQGGGTQPPPTLTAPHTVVASATSATSCVITWQDNNTAVDEFVVQRRTGANDWVESARVPGTTLTAIDGVLAGGVTYTFRVAAIKAGISSPFSAAVDATTPAALRTWGANRPLSSEPTGDVATVVGLDGQAVAIAAGPTGQPGVWRVRAAELRAGQAAWSPFVTLDGEVADARETDAQLAVAPSGIYYAAWFRTAGAQCSVHVATMPQGRSWMRAQKVTGSDTPGECYGLKLSIDARGMGVITWGSIDGSTHRLTAAVTTADGTAFGHLFSEEMPAGNLLVGHDLALDGSGQALVTYGVQSSDGATSKLRLAAFSAVSGAWTSADGPALSAAAGVVVRQPQTAMVGDVLVAVWLQWLAATESEELWSARRETSGNWSAPKRLVGSAKALYTPTLVKLGANDAMLVVAACDATTCAVDALTPLMDGDWGTARVTAFPVGTQVLYPALAMGGGGAVMTWTRLDNNATRMTVEACVRQGNAWGAVATVYTAKDRDSFVVSSVLRHADGIARVISAVREAGLVEATYE